MVSIGCYQVQVRTYVFGGKIGRKTAFLLPAKELDMPLNWDFVWKELFEKTRFDAEGLTKLVFQEKVFGLVRYSLYPCPEKPKYIFINQMEAIPNGSGLISERLVEPIGKWLLWYVIQVALSRCSKDVKDKGDNNLVVLEALDSAFDYYRDKIGMRHLGSSGGAPGEDVSIFAFSWDEAKVFCTEQTKKHGSPNILKA